MDFIHSFFVKLSVAPMWLWEGFVVAILVLLMIDLALFGHGEKKNKKRVAIIESLGWIGVALLFNLWLWFHFGPKIGIEFFTGYLVEKSLSVDNLFVMLLIFNSLKIPDHAQHRVLFYGILGAIIFRAAFILVGAQLMHTFHFVIYIFGGILLVTAVRILKHNDENVDPEKNLGVRIMKKFYPVTPQFDGDKFFIKSGGVKYATPLFVALIIIEATDIIFAVDSIPAVFAITSDAFVAFSSNILAILGLRALYFVLADFVSKLKYLKPGLALILAFIGFKMVAIDFIKVPSGISLSVIVLILAVVSFLSLKK